MNTSGSFCFTIALLCVLVLSGFFSACETDDVAPPPAVARVSVNPSIITEAQGEATVTVSLSSTSEADVMVTLSTAGTASASDYSISGLQVTIPAGDTAAAVTITAIQDTEDEANEVILISIQSVDGAEEDGVQEVSLTIEDDDGVVTVQLILNEICYDPSNSGLNGDTNGDGRYAQAEDEFLEFVNLSASELDVSGYKLYDEENLAINVPNHTIPANTVIPAGGALVIFGGGTPTGSFGGALVQTSTSGDFNLNNSGDKLYVFDAADTEILTFDIEPLSNNPNESYTRNPDLTGDFVQHREATTGVLFSPGTKIDGSPF
ncbi:MAG: lamin tail domain-containing protein [Bacteroidota bacterium]